MVRRRRVALAAVAGLAVAAALYSWSRSDVPSAGAAAPPPRASEVLPRIDLKRLSSRPSAPPLGQRDVFDFGPPPTVATPPPTLPRSTVAAAPTPPPPPTAVPLAPINVKYIGTLERKPGLKVAVFLSDDKEVLTGQAGEVIANRYRIVKIGLESVDLQDVTSGQVRRVPLRGN